MGEASGLFTGFRITNYYKFILYLAGVILILSLFVDAVDFDNVKLRVIAFEIVLAGLLIWFIKTITGSLKDWFLYYKDKRTISTDAVETYLMIFFAIEIMIQVIIWLIIFIRHF